MATLQVQEGRRVGMGAVLIGSVAFVGGMILLARVLRRHEREGHFDKEGHGTPGRQEPGVRYRPLEVPGKPPFD